MRRRAGANTCHALGSWLLALSVAVGAVMGACGDDDDGTEADRRGVGAQCTNNDDCTEEGQVCLTQFAGGYCGLADCNLDADCPHGSKCVTHTDSRNYCFLVCVDKPDCNINRDAANESNCSSNVTFVEDQQGIKACVPPSSGT